MTTMSTTLTLAQARGAARHWLDPRIVRRFANQHDVPPHEAARCFEAFKQFLAVCAISDEECSPSRDVDEMWHCALMFSRSYHDFCWQRLERFVHHEPIDGLVKRDVYAATRATAETLFGALDERYWPHPDLAPRCGSMYVP
jgi:hypothetical protein